MPCSGVKTPGYASCVRACASAPGRGESPRDSPAFVELLSLPSPDSFTKTAETAADARTGERASTAAETSIFRNTAGGEARLWLRQSATTTCDHHGTTTASTKTRHHAPGYAAYPRPPRDPPNVGILVFVASGSREATQSGNAARSTENAAHALA